MTPTVDLLRAAGVRNPEPWLVPVQEALQRFDIATARQVAAWLAQTAHESNGFSVLVENLNYSADGMAAIWPSRFAVMSEDKKPVKVNGRNQPNKFALALHRQPEMIANVVYASRMGNGPVESGHGWRYRGRGLKQLTGLDNYRMCGMALNEDFVGNPDLLLTPKWAAMSAAWFWAANKCGPLADTGDFVGLTRRINGGTIGLEDRQRRYDAVLSGVGVV